MKRHPFAAFLFAAVAPALTAQCAFSSVSISSTGPGCSTVFSTLPTLSAGLDVNACELDLTVSAFPGCCNTFLTGRVLAIGLSPGNQPLPIVGPNCTLWLQADAVLYLPSAGGNTFTLQLPPALQPPFAFHAQGAAIYFTTIGFSTDVELTGGALVTLQ